MIQFKHKKHLHQEKEGGKLVVYYNTYDIVLGLMLMVLVVFFMHDYLSHALRVNHKTSPAYSNHRPLN